MNRNCVPIISSRYLLRTFAVPTKYQLNYMFGFRFKAKPEHVAAKVRRWYGVGVGMVYADGGGGRLGCDAARCVATNAAPNRRHCGEGDAAHAAPTIICAYGGINGNCEWGEHDAARRIATSSEKGENRF